MANHCAACQSTDTNTALDGWTCSICGAHTINGQAVTRGTEVVEVLSPSESAVVPTVTAEPAE